MSRSKCTTALSQCLLGSTQPSNFISASFIFFHTSLAHRSPRVLILLHVLRKLSDASFVPLGVCRCTLKRTCILIVFPNEVPSSASSFFTVRRSAIYHCRVLDDRSISPGSRGDNRIPPPRRSPNPFAAAAAVDFSGLLTPPSGERQLAFFDCRVRTFLIARSLTTRSIRSAIGRLIGFRNSIEASLRARFAAKLGLRMSEHSLG